MNPKPPPRWNTVDQRKKYYEGMLLQELKLHMNTQREYKNDLIDNWAGDSEADWFAHLKDGELPKKKLQATKKTTATTTTTTTTKQEDPQNND